jgi:alanyl-tRNA synthetase
VRTLEKEAEQLKGKLASSQGTDLLSAAQDIGGLKVLAATLNADAKTLRDTVDQLKNKLGSAAVVLASVSEDGKVSLVAGVTADWTQRIRAGELVNFVASQVGGKGGGRPDMAQAGGTDPAALPAALAAVPSWVKTQLGA